MKTRHRAQERDVWGPFSGLILFALLYSADVHARTHAHRFPVHIHPCVVIYLVVRSRVPLVCGPRLFRSSHDLRENPAGLRQMPPEGLSEDDSGHVPTGTPVASSFCCRRQEGKAGQLWDH